MKFQSPPQQSLKPIAAAVGLALASLAQPALATEFYWVCGSGAWNSNCWSTTVGGKVVPGRPATGDIVYLNQSDSINRIVQFGNTSYENATLSGLGINATGRGLMTLSITGDSSFMSAISVAVGDTGGGAVAQSAGTVEAGGLWVGVGDAGNGRYSLSGGSLNVYEEGIGYHGQGTFTQTGGTHRLGDGSLLPNGTLHLGLFAGASGTYNLAGGSLTAGNEWIGDGGTGTFAQSAGSNFAMVFGLGVNGSASSGSYTLSGGSLQGGSAAIGSEGKGVFTQTGGSNELTGLFGPNALMLGIHAGASGTYNLDGGTLTAYNEQIGYEGAGTFNQTAGVNSVTQDLGLAVADGSRGTYYLKGGSLNVAGNIVGGTGSSTLTLDGGSLTVGGGSISVGAFNIGNATGSSFTFGLAGGQSVSAYTEVVGYNGTGAVAHSGGTNIVTNLSVGTYGSGSYNLNGGILSAVSEHVGFAGTGRFAQAGGSNTTTYLMLGIAGGTGSYTLSGGNLNVLNQVSGGNASTLNLDGGSFSFGNAVAVDTLNIGNAANSSFTFAIGSGQTVSARSEILGVDGIGNVIQTGGHHTVGTLGIANGTYTLANGTLTVNSALDNGDALLLGGGSIDGNGALTNNGLVLGFGTIGGSGGFTNNSFMSVVGGNLELANTGANLNAANLDLAAGLQLKLTGGNLSNSGSINLNAGSVTGSAGFTNLAGGTISGRGTIGTAFRNYGTLVVDAGATSITRNFANPGIIQLGSNAANLSGGNIGNSGHIEGYGKVNNAIANNGAIEAIGGTLTLAGTVTSTGSLIANSGAKILVSNGLASNAGNIQLLGGAFDNNGHAMANSGVISGAGILRSGGLANNGQIQLNTGASQVYGEVTSANGSKIIVSGNGTVSFYDGVDLQSGAEFRVASGATATFFGFVHERTGAQITGTGDKFYEGGLSIGASPGYVYDAGNVTFGDSNVYLAEIGGVTACTADCATNEALKDSRFDKYVVAGNLNFGGTLTLTSWDGFVAQAGQRFDLIDWGSAGGSFASIDASGLQLASGTRLDTSRLYIDGSISVAAVPEPETYAMLLAGLGLMGAMTKRQRRRNSSTRQLS